MPLRELKIPTKKKKWEIKEDSDKKLFVGKKTRSSGNKWFDPGDIKTEDFLIEVKQTEHASYPLRKEIWEKICREALMKYKLPMMSIQIQDTEVVVLSKEDFLKYIKSS